MLTVSIGCCLRGDANTPTALATGACHPGDTPAAASTVQVYDTNNHTVSGMLAGLIAASSRVTLTRPAEAAGVDDHTWRTIRGSTTTGNVTGYVWAFGDGYTSTLTNTTHTYTSVGVYTVSLTVSGPDGTDEEIKASYITVTSTTQAPVAGFSASPTSGPVSLTVTFTNTTTGDVTGYEWAFGDGLTSTLTSPTHTYTTAGVYTVPWLTFRHLRFFHDTTILK